MRYIQFPIILTLIIRVQGQQMREPNHKDGRAAHGDTRPDRRDGHIEVVEQASHNGHHCQVIYECPEEVDVDEQVALCEQLHECHNFV